MKKHTTEELVRLVPEMNGRTITIPSDRNPDPTDLLLLTLLLTTRAKLEVARGALERIAAGNCSTDAREALAKIKEMG